MPLIGEGRRVVVLDLGDGRVLRRYRARDRDAGLEAAAMEHARRHGVPVPAVHDVDGPDLVMDRVDGPSMLEDVLMHPERTIQHARTLAALHRTLDRVDAPASLGLPTPTGVHGRLLHGDLHPGNVILSADGPMIIDWTNVASGPGAVDVATSWLLIACFDHSDRVVNVTVNRLRQGFLAPFLAVVGRADAARALPVVARIRALDPATSEIENARALVLVQQEAARLRRDAGPPHQPADRGLISTARGPGPTR
jgi:aminoglycoside phosphotransferase (APT) family kinase protein